MRNEREALPTEVDRPLRQAMLESLGRADIFNIERRSART